MDILRTKITQNIKRNAETKFRKILTEFVGISRDVK